MGASVHSNDIWRAIHVAPSVATFEVELGKETRRWAYNTRCLAQARATGRIHRGTHAGFHDSFMPLAGPGGGDSVLVVGPFAARRPTTESVTECWRELSGTLPHLTDHAFARYLSETLATLTLEGRLIGVLERLVKCCAALLGGVGAAPAKTASEVDGLKLELLRARYAERMWEAARSMVDVRTTRMWTTEFMLGPLAGLGMERAPEHVLVGLLRDRADAPDPLDQALRRDAVQRAIADLARRRGNAAGGKVGDRGITLLAAIRGGAGRARSALLDLAAQAERAAGRLGFRLHTGIAAALPPHALASRYGAALAAAERAFLEGTAVRIDDSRADRWPGALSELRGRLAKVVEDDPALLYARFDRYIEAVASHCGHSLDAARAHLEAGFERVTEPLLASGALDKRSLDDLSHGLESLHGTDETVPGLFAAYRSAVADIARAVEDATAARQDRSVRRGLAFMREYLAEPLTLTQVSRVAGFSHGHFARLLKREQGTSFVRLLASLRVERAKYLLSTTSAPVAWIAERSGFRSRTHFHRAFQRHTGSTPAAYRSRANAGLTRARSVSPHVVRRAVS